MFGIRSLTVTVTVFILMELIVLSEQSLKFGDKGVCVRNVANTPNCPKKKKCPITYTRKPGCCPNWQFKNGRCVPLCPSGCKNGICYDVDDCRCTPPRVLKNHECVIVTCDPPCLNGECVDNVCKCYPNTTSFNNTHCTINCPSGYVNGHIGGYFNNPMECKPRCEIPCKNSTCTAPNTCTCIDGYENLVTDNSTCVPKCNPPCINGECLAPGLCICSPGYTAESHESSHKCKPVCTNCTNGDCIAPGVCECHERYSKKGDICTPDCDEKCVNGICSEPNKCTCDVGYKIDSKNKFYCQPICNNKCVNASCLAPNKCSCLPGYVRENEWSCRPECSSCENGECVSPNNCRCNKGYSKNGNNTCSPDCKESCIRGQCTAPDVCSCSEGYVLEKDRVTCNPICDGGCINSTCVLPNKCDCLPDYERQSSSACKPKCHSCINADCVAPHVCRCHEGYTKADGNCFPICHKPCVNGKCSIPDVCECKDGYIHNVTDPSICYKPCEEPCNNGKCSEHGECICDTGYELQNGTCVVIQIIDCATCISNCEDACVCEDRPSRPTCISYPVKEASSTSMASLQLTWLMGGAVGFLLLTLVIVVIQRIWTKRQSYDNKAVANDGGLGSVIYTVPDTLMHRRSLEYDDIQDEFYEEVALDANLAHYENDLEGTREKLLAAKNVENERL